MPVHEVLTPEEAAEYLRVDPQTIYRPLREGKLPGARIGRQWRISRQALEEFLRGGAFVDNKAEDEKEDIEWLDAGAQDVVDRLDALEAEIPPEERKACKQAMAKAVKPAKYVPGKGLVLDGEP